MKISERDCENTMKEAFPWFVQSSWSMEETGDVVTSYRGSCVMERERGKIDHSPRPCVLRASLIPEGGSSLCTVVPEGLDLGFLLQSTYIVYGSTSSRTLPAKYETSG